MYRNPDGSTGGFIEKTVQISGTPLIDATSVICGKVKISGPSVVIKNSKISDEVIIVGPATIENSTLFQGASVSNKAVVKNSTVCQSSVIDGFENLDSKYYCQTEDPEPQPPGELGLKTVMGIDSDNDGVRDDVEIFINVNLPNTPSKNRKDERTQSKFFAFILQREFANIENKLLLEKLEDAKQDVMKCLVLSKEEDIYGEMSNTKERFYAVLKINGLNHGKEIQIKPCRTFEQIKESIKGI